MANRRMFAKSIIDTDYFLEMPATTQLLYFHLAMRADDDGFVSSPKRILRMVGSSEDDFKVLISKQFIIPFDSGVCVIKHWRIHNLIRGDRYQATIYTQEKSMLTEDDNKSYKLVHPDVIPDVIPEVNPVKVSIGKDSKVKDSIDNIPYSEIIDYLNSQSGSRYRNTDSTRRLIHARFNEGFTKEDFIKVIDNKVNSWVGTEFEKYIRPSTLFSPKFDGYLNESKSGRENDVRVTKTAWEEMNES